MATTLLGMYQQIRQWPCGHWLFAKAVCFKAPYFSNISPTITRLENGCCEARIKDRRGVRNHIGSVHAIALCNLAELAAGLMTDASLPPGMRWIPKGMQVAYLKRAKGDMRATATPATPLIASATSYELPVNVVIRDSAGDSVLHAEIRMWLSPKR